MRRANVISGAVLTVFSLVMLFVIIPWQIDPAPKGMISTRLVPNLMMIAIAAMSVVLIVTNLKSANGATDPSPLTLADLRVVLRIGGLFAAVIALYLLIGPLPAGFALVFGGLLLLGERRPVMLAGMPVLLLTALWLLFYKVLGTAIV
ncbi:tripartite tricarboxylate transporter TctB family protein [Roseibium marinum]|uniref:Tripartite tricarboxylate transporter TctB family protein n=1 Tax=Roseibium marinum TaxID=281252 RepID=A0A2S3V533_9HYPH|nr:tripartite tricarboxylate transporter TctB family protein [Roseibium marinum]POF34903.1 tripartite tricarboxylate transporter TctB family protein [Roseibium marinum]